MDKIDVLKFEEERFKQQENKLTMSLLDDKLAGYNWLWDNSYTKLDVSDEEKHKFIIKLFEKNFLKAEDLKDWSINHKNIFNLFCSQYLGLRKNVYYKTCYHAMAEKYIDYLISVGGEYLFVEFMRKQHPCDDRGAVWEILQKRGYQKVGYGNITKWIYFNPQKKSTKDDQKFYLKVIKESLIDLKVIKDIYDKEERKIPIKTLCKLISHYYVKLDENSLQSDFIQKNIKIFNHILQTSNKHGQKVDELKEYYKGVIESDEEICMDFYEMCNKIDRLLSLSISNTNKLVRFYDLTGIHPEEFITFLNKTITYAESGKRKELINLKVKCKKISNLNTKRNVPTKESLKDMRFKQIFANGEIVDYTNDEIYQNLCEKVDKYMEKYALSKYEDCVRNVACCIIEKEDPLAKKSEKTF